MNTSRTKSGFTLIELLASIGIIAVLSALLVPTVAKIRSSADSTKCSSNLRQLGIAINLYATDNDDRLPGPIGSGVGRTLINNQASQLIYQLQPYLELPAPTSTAIYPKILQCPALRGSVLGTQKNWYDVTAYVGYSNNDLPTAKQYLSDRTVVDSNSQSWPVGPWGRSNSSPGTPGWKRAWLIDGINESKTLPSGEKPTLASIPAIREIDATLKSWPWPVPTRSVHGSHHNVLFFDWHVERMPVTAYK